MFELFSNFVEMVGYKIYFVEIGFGVLLILIYGGGVGVDGLGNW